MLSCYQQYEQSAYLNSLRSVVWNWYALNGCVSCIDVSCWADTRYKNRILEPLLPKLVYTLLPLQIFRAVVVSIPNLYFGNLRLESRAHCRLLLMSSLVFFHKTVVCNSSQLIMEILSSLDGSDWSDSQHGHYRSYQESIPSSPTHSLTILTEVTQ
jgi:hypothetical protein